MMRLLKEIQKAAVDVGYHDKDDDEFLYDLGELERQFLDVRTIEEVLAGGGVDE